MPPKIDFVGEPVTAAEEETTGSRAYWQNRIDEGPVEDLKRLEEAARQLVVLTSTLQTIYFAVFTVSGLWGRLPGWLVTLALLPVALWLLSLFAATWALIPRPRLSASRNELREDAWRRLRRAYLEAVQDKRRTLRLAYLLLAASLAVVLAVFVALAGQPGTEAAPLHVVIVTPAPAPTPTP